jgi:hypothetical protein
MRNRSLVILGVLLLLVLASSCASDSESTPEPQAEDEEAAGGEESSESSQGACRGGNTTTSEHDAAANESPGWPDLQDATVRSGVGIYAYDGPTTDTTEQHRCTSNFLFRSPDNSSLYLGTAAHCGDATVNDTVQIAGGEATGTLVYNSHQLQNNTNQNALENGSWANDFALVEIHDEHRDRVQPAMLHYGGPTALGDTSTLEPGDPVRAYGNATAQDTASTQARASSPATTPSYPPACQERPTTGPSPSTSFRPGSGGTPVALSSRATARPSASIPHKASTRQEPRWSHDSTSSWTTCTTKPTSRSNS